MYKDIKAAFIVLMFRDVLKTKRRHNNVAPEIQTLNHDQSSLRVWPNFSLTMCKCSTIMLYRNRIFLLLRFKTFNVFF